MQIDVNRWYYSEDYKEHCRVIETQTIWGETTCQVWIPGNDSVVRTPASKLNSLDNVGIASPYNIGYAVAAARVADALTQDVLLAPIESSVIPLPHQIRALARAVSNDRVRYLLADEVGLGKTIEAGLIMRELKLRGLVKRTLVVAPKGLVTQWVTEMQVHFGEEMQLILPDDLATLRRIKPIVRDLALVKEGKESEVSSFSHHQSNPWQMFRQVIVPIDSFKPLDKRRGWKKEEIAEYNRERFENLITAGWDLIIVDEAHRLGGSTEQVARHKLGQGLSEASPYLLLLTATPHQGKTDAFHRLISLLDGRSFPDPESVSKDAVRPYVIRMEKRRAIDSEGKALFVPRHTQLIPIALAEGHRNQRILYDAVTHYVRNNYNLAMKEKKTYLGLLLILMQRLVTSSTMAIRTTLERRLEVLRTPEEQLSLFPAYSDEEWSDLDGQEQVNALLQSRLSAMKNEREEVKLLLDVAKKTEESGPDVKAASLLEKIYLMQQQEGDPSLKILVFTEFVPTQEMLRSFLCDRGFQVTCLNGTMSMEERLKAQESFSKDAQILISTDAGGEGLNLQFCHVVINYDIPWNPMRLEQRIGRVDRIGQQHKVQALNFVLEDTVEFRVREVLEEKLWIILREFGVDKAGDVLDSAQAGQILEDLYMEAILRPDSLDAKLAEAMQRIREQAQANRENISLLGESVEFDPAETKRLLTHPLPYWVEQMTVNYLRGHGGKAERRGSVWHLIWPDGKEHPEAVFTRREADLWTSAVHLTLEHPAIRSLLEKIPRFVPGQPIACIEVRDLAPDLKGIWSLWSVALHSPDLTKKRILPLFMHEDGRVLAPTARYIWDQLLFSEPQVKGYVSGAAAPRIYDQAWKAAEKHGKEIYEGLLRNHQEGVAKEGEKGERAFQSRRRLIEKIGLPAVRRHRLLELEKEEKGWRRKTENQVRVSPEMVALVVVRVGSETKNG